jgi:hypothetical protein
MLLPLALEAAAQLLTQELAVAQVVFLGVGH